jgi:Holliday junction resolvase RusA-like endonuclease
MTSPPSLNRLWITVPGKRRVRSAEYNKWRTEAGWEIKQQVAGMDPLPCRYDMEISVPISRRDTGNWEKAIGDILESVGVVTNDGNVNRLTIVPMDRTNCAVAITPLPGMGGVRRKQTTLGLPTSRKPRENKATKAKWAAIQRGMG